MFLFLNGVDTGAAAVTIYVRNNQNRTKKQKKVLVYAVESSQSSVQTFFAGNSKTNACTRVVHQSSMDICVGLYQVPMCVLVCVPVSASVSVTQFIV